jgi:DNA-binding NarL/FixJ family response regulator
VRGKNGLRILVVDDHPLLHETLGAVARSVVPEAVIHAETTLAEALERARELRADLELVLLDLGLPGCTGIEALTRFRAAAPTVRIVVISAIEDPATVEAAIQAGAAGYIPKTTVPPQMVEALRLVLSGGVYLPMQVMEATQPQGARLPRHRAAAQDFREHGEAALPRALPHPRGQFAHRSLHRAGAQRHQAGLGFIRLS